MTKFENSNKPYDLEERVFLFAKEVRIAIKSLPKSTANFEDIKQLVRSPGSIGANYIEANESLGKKDFLMRVKISRKEAKESAYWLRLILETNELSEKKNVEKILKEAIELNKILSAIIEKSKI